MCKFDPQKIEKTVISIRIEENILKKIDKLSNQRELSRNEFILQCIDFSLKHMKQQQ